MAFSTSAGTPIDDRWIAVEFYSLCQFRGKLCNHVVFVIIHRVLEGRYIIRVTVKRLVFSLTDDIRHPRIKFARITFPRNEIFDATVAALPRPEYVIDIEVFVIELCDLLEFLIIKPTFYTFARQIYEFVLEGNDGQRLNLEDFVRPIAQITDVSASRFALCRPPRTFTCAISAWSDTDVYAPYVPWRSLPPVSYLCCDDKCYCTNAACRPARPRNV